MVYAPTWSMEHEAPLNCSSQIIHTYIHAYIRVPKRDRNRNFPAKYVLNRIFSHLGPGQVLFKIQFKFSCSHLLYYPGGSTLHTYTNYTCLSYIYTTKAFVELPDASPQLKFNQTGGSTLHCVECRLQFYYMYCTEARTCTLSC